MSDIEINQGIGAAIKYNPHLLGADELRATFVARKKELRRVLEIIADTDANTVPQHLLITGQRGMGKSTLLQRVALAVEEDEELFKKWVPLRFPEEQYTVNTLAEFWANVLGALADTLEPASQEQLEIDDYLESLEQQSTSDHEKMTLAFLQSWCDRNKRRLILLVDSTDLLLANLSNGGRKKKADPGAPQLWRLRDTLQNNPCLFWLGGSYQPVDAEALYQDTFLDFFYNIELKPLNLDEVCDCMRELARVFGIGRNISGDKAVSEIEKIFELYPARLRTMHLLSGGNLRTTVMLYGLLSSGGKDDVSADLRRLLDDISPLYKARMESLPEQQRKILAHLFESWAPISIARLAEVSNLEKTSLSPQLQRLELEGLIEKTKLPNTSRSGYQVSERFFNIWYLMRNAPRRLRMRLSYLVSFMRLWFDSKQLLELATRQNDKLCSSESGSLEDYEYSRAIAFALPEENPLKYQLEVNAIKLVVRNFHSGLNDILDLTGEDKPFATLVEYLKRFEALKSKLHALKLEPNEELEDWADNLLASISLTLDEKERVALAVSTLEECQLLELNMIMREERDRISKLLGERNYMLMRGAFLAGDFFSDVPDSELAYTQLIKNFSKNKVVYNLLLGLYSSKHSDIFVERAFLEAIEQDPDNDALWEGLGVLYADSFARFEEAEQAIQKAIELDPKNAHYWNRLGNLFKNSVGRYEEAEQAYRKAIELDPKFKYPWHSLGNLLTAHLARYEEAEQAYRNAIELDSKSASPWNSLGNLLAAHLARYEEAEQAYRKAIELDPEFASPWNNLGNLFQDHLQLYDKAETALRKCISLDESDAYGYANLARLLLVSKKDKAEVVELYRNAISRAENELELLLQANLYLENSDLAMQALDGLAADASVGNGLSFNKLKVQCIECFCVGLGSDLAELMQRSRYKAFLQPFTLALRAAGGDDQALLSAPVEVVDMANEVLFELTK